MDLGQNMSTPMASHNFHASTSGSFHVKLGLRDQPKDFLFKGLARKEEERLVEE